MSRRSFNPSEDPLSPSSPRQSSGQAKRPSLTSQSGQQRPADSLRLALPPLQFDPSRSSGPSTAHAILHPPDKPRSLEQEPQSGHGPYVQATASAGEQYGREEAAAGGLGSQHYGQQQNHYRSSDPYRQANSASSVYPQHSGGQWFPPLSQSQSAPSSGSAYPRGSQSQRPVLPPEYGPHSSGPWQMEQQAGAPLSAYAGRAASASVPGLPQHNQTYVLDLPHGPMSVPLNTQTASKAADEKRKRNAGASARFRQRRKEKEKANSHEIEELRQELDNREKQIEYYRGERDFFVSVVARGPDRDLIRQRALSPPRSRAFVPRAESTRTSSPDSSTTFQEQGVRDSEGSYARRRLTEDGPNRQLPPQQQPPQQQASGGQYGYVSATGRSTGYPYPSQEVQYQYPQQTQQAQQAQQQYAHSLPPPQTASARPEYGTSLADRTYQQQGQADPGQRWAPGGR